MMPLHGIERELAHRGWLFSRQRSSHRHYRNEPGQRLIVNVHGGAHTPLNWRQVDAIRRALQRLAREGGPDAT
jgi:predicted RNA binding protein YcfA (HicA-like mRNA interferase family)